MLSHCYPLQVVLNLYLNMNINAQQVILNAYISSNYAFRITCWALIFIFRLRFPPGISIATILKFVFISYITIQLRRDQLLLLFIILLIEITY